MRPETCWTNKTPFQATLIFFLIVAIPVFIILISVYIYALAIYPPEQDCQKMCDVFLMWKKTQLRNAFSDYVADRTDERVINPPDYLCEDETCIKSRFVNLNENVKYVDEGPPPESNDTIAGNSTSVETSTGSSSTAEPENPV